MFLAPTIVNFDLGGLSLILRSSYQPVARMKISKLARSLVVSPLGMFFNSSVQVIDVRTDGRTHQLITHRHFVLVEYILLQCN